MTRMITLALTAALFTACTDADVAESRTDPDVAESRTGTFSLSQSFTGEGLVVGATIAAYDPADLVTPFGTSVTDAEGWADITSDAWPDDRFVLHAAADGYHDTWAYNPAWWYTEMVSGDFALGNTPIVRDDVWAEQHRMAGLEPDPNLGGLAIAGLDDMEAELDREARVVYLNANGEPDPMLTSSPIGEAFVLALEPGDITVTVRSPEETVTWTVEVVADALTVASTHPK